MISRSPGLVIGMFYNDHGPPHFHARYGEHEIRVNIDTGEIWPGSFLAERRNSCWNGYLCIEATHSRTGSSLPHASC